MKDPQNDPGFGVCSICGERYLKPACSLYKVKFAGKIFATCSYKCFRIAQKTKESEVSSQYQKYMKAVTV